MADTIEFILKIHNWFNSVPKIQAGLQKTASPLRLGVLSAAGINQTAIYDPVSTHPDVVIAGLAARSRDKAQAQATKYNLGSTVKIYNSYDDLLDDPRIEAVYIPLPNALHARWTIKALQKGKHVLLEKPMANNADEVDQIVAAAREARKVVLEAYHWRFHPACHLLQSLLVDHETYGLVEDVKIKFVLPSGTHKEDDIRFDYSLGGGAMMDLCYVFSTSLLCATGGDQHNYVRAKIEAKSAVPRICKRDDKIDEYMHAQYQVRLPSTDPSIPERIIDCQVEADLAQPKIFGIMPRFWDAFPTISVETSRASIQMTNFVAPWVYHAITIREKDQNGTLTGKKTTQKTYVGGPLWAKLNRASRDGDTASNEEVGESWWTTYRYQLEAFVNQVRRVDSGVDVNEEISGPWVTLEESKKLMEVIDAVYEKAGLPKRGVA